MTKPLTKHEVQDHRTRVGEERRERMRTHLIESALFIFSSKGVEGSSIDDVIRTAKVSRGTFYNYFRTTEELLVALGRRLGNDLIDLVEAAVKKLERPIDRLGLGVRMFLHVAEQHPRFASYLWRAGFNAASAGEHLVLVYLPRHIEEAIARQELTSDPTTALHALVGLSLAAIFGMNTQRVPPDYIERMVRHILLALGAKNADIKRVLALPLPVLMLPSDSLLARTRRPGRRENP